MAGAKEPQSQETDAIGVGYQFVQQYYNVMSKDPSKLHHFYKKQSTFTHGDEGNRQVESVTGQKV